MSTVSLLFTIRNARLDEFDTIGRLHRTAMASDAAWQLLNAKADPDEWLRWTWDETYRALSAAYPPTNPDPESYPRGVNEEESTKLAVLGLKWQTDLLRKYGEFIYVHNFAISPAYQSRGLGKALMLEVIRRAKHERLNIALFAVSGKVEFYQKFGFKQVAPPIMLRGGTVEGGTMMVLEELFRLVREADPIG